MAPNGITLVTVNTVRFRFRAAEHERSRHLHYCLILVTLLFTVGFSSGTPLDQNLLIGDVDRTRPSGWAWFVLWGP